ncbi:hypothetical protein PENTCL1PPCAC_14871, partial [Pristionchus entomophagus]
RNVSLQERGGIAVALLKKGKLEVDLWAGYADPTANQLWKEDTLAVAFSTTKVFIGIIFALLKREGRFKYSDKVSDIWPEFASHGKDNITIGQVVDHKAGLLSFSRDFSLEESRDPALMASIIVQTTPQWTPGTKMGYCGISYGFLIDQLVMRLDKKGRSASAFFKDEIRSRSSDKDFFLGLPDQENHRVARVTNPSLLASAAAHLSHPLQYVKILRNFFSNGMIAEASAKYPAFLDLMNPSVVPYNSPDIRTLPLISCLGIGTARAMAATLHAASSLLTKEELEDLMIPLGEEEDFILSKKKTFGRGFTYIAHPHHHNRFMVSFWGNGLQTVSWDPVDDVIFVVFRNGLQAGDNGRGDMEALIREAF